MKKIKKEMWEILQPRILMKQINGVSVYKCDECKKEFDSCVLALKHYICKNNKDENSIDIKK